MSLWYILGVCWRVFVEHMRARRALRGVELEWIRTDVAIRGRRVRREDEKPGDEEITLEDEWRELQARGGAE